MNAPSRVRRAFVASVFLAVAVVAPAAARAQVILSDIVAGGDGSGNAPAGVIGIDPRNGEFTDTGIAGHIFETDAVGDALNPSPVAASDLVDSVFIIGEAVFDDLGARVAPVAGGEPVIVALTQSGAEFEFPSQDAFGSSWNHVLANQNAGGGTLFQVGGQTVAHGVGVHAACGVTFDLDAIRAAHGAANVGCFQTIAGMDGCGGDVNLYVIQCDESEVLTSETLNALANSGTLLQVDILADAKYLTLATGSNGADGCDHGNFGLARIVAGPCPDEIPTVSLAVTPALASIAPNGLLQLSVIATSDLGQPTDVTAGFTGTTYSSDPAGIVSVSADGLVSGLATGATTITASFDGLDATAAITVAVPDYIDLGDVAVGGNGFGTADPLNIGINGDTGAYVQARLAAGVPEANLINPMPVDGADGSADNPFVNSVFIMELDVGQPINTELVTFDFELGDPDQGWEAILNGREPGGADFLEFGLRGDGTAIVFEQGLGVHASQGITFDLAELRAEHGADAVRFISAVAGDLTSERNGAGSVNCYIILSDETEVIDVRRFLGAANVGRFLEMAIPEEAVFATFAVGDTNNGIGSDHGGFGLARITQASVPTELASIRVNPTTLVLDIGQSRQLRVDGILGGALDGVTTEIAADQISAIPQRVQELKAMHQMVDEAIRILNGSGDLLEFGRLLEESWNLKRRLSDKISTPHIDAMYETAQRAGCVGGKLLGAGGGGFLLLFVRPEEQERVRSGLKGLLEVPFRFETVGAQVVFYDRDGSYRK